MLKDRESVYAQAEEMAEKYRLKLLAAAEGRTIEEEEVVDLADLDIPSALEDGDEEAAIATEE
jgi:hypothetical protein